MITIGTDCSGIEAPIEALKQLRIPFQHKWACEIDKFARQSILANYEPEILYEDITKRDHSQLPDVDIYVCGFPCQSFSSMGNKRGTQDPRANIMLHCIDVISQKRPNVFILENVKNFCNVEKKKPFTYLINQLKQLCNDSGESEYFLHYSIYNTKDYGIPHNRERLQQLNKSIDTT
jgi:DNA (cytosine-5)-methyltransferase 1